MHNTNENPLVDFKEPVFKNQNKIDDFKMNLMLKQIKSHRRERIKGQ